MALLSNIVTVTSTPVALHSAGPTQLSVRNLGLGTVYLGTSGAGNQKYPLASGTSLTLALDAAGVLYARSDEGTVQVAVLQN